MPSAPPSLAQLPLLISTWFRSKWLRGTGETDKPRRHPARLPETQLLEEIIALVVDHDEGGEILHLDAPDRLHAELRIFDHLDLLDAVLGEIGGSAPDRGKIEAAVLLAGVPHLRRTVALGDRHHGAAGGLEIIDEAVHPPRRRRAKRAGRIAPGRFCRAGGLDRVIFEIHGHPWPFLETIGQ